jgi:hypothetical protein
VLNPLGLVEMLDVSRPLQFRKTVTVDFEKPTTIAQIGLESNQLIAGWGFWPFEDVEQPLKGRSKAWFKSPDFWVTVRTPSAPA